MKNLIQLLSFLALVFIFSACGQDKQNNLTDLLQENTENQNALERRGAGFQLSNIPQFRDGLAAFDDFEQFTEFYKELEEIDNNEGGQNLDQYMYDLVPYTSISKRMMDDGFESPEERYQPELADDIMAYILNEHHEFQIKDKILVYATNEDIVSFLADDIDTRIVVQNMPKGNNYSIFNVPETANTNDISDGGEVIVLAGIFCGCDVRVDAVDCCTARVSGRCKTFGDGGGEVVIRITHPILLDMIVVNETHQVDGNFEFTYNLCSFGMEQLRVEATAESNCIFGGDDRDVQVLNANGVSCDPDNKDSGWLWSEQNGEALSYRVNTWENWFSHYNKAEVCSFRWSSIHNEWRKTDADFLSAQIDVERRNISCGFFSFDDQTKPCTNCNRRKVKVNTGLAQTGGDFFTRYCTGDVTGIFLKVNNGALMEVVHDLEFECCL